MKQNEEQQDRSGDSEDRLAQGKASLESMMEILRPFLPASDLTSPEPAREWHLTDAKCNLPRTGGLGNPVLSSV